MVKADLTRDYYADLGLTPSATEVEIKKSFRLLAMKYHPDRNPGRELEVNPKFQIIQSAHEVLTDAEQRAKYDLGRSRSSGFFASQSRPSSGFARGNPWANAGSDFPPPPRPPPTRSRAQPPPSAGAARYANNFKASGFGTSSAPPRPAEDDGAEARRKTYEAWARMRGSERPKPPPPQPSAQGYPSSSGYDDTGKSQPAPKPGPPPVPKRSGYAPANSGGDEPPASNTSAYFTQRHRAPTAKQQSYPEASPRPQSNVDPLKQFREKAKTPLEPRLSTPYSAQGGEKTNPFESVNVGRSNSTRAAPGMADEDGNSGPFGRSRDRRRSASPSRTSRRPDLAPDSNANNSEATFNTSPKRTYSKSTKPSNLGEQPRTRPPIIDLTSSDDDSADDRRGAFGTRPRVFAKGRSRRRQENATPTRPSGTSQASQNTQNYGNPSTPNGPNVDPKMYGASERSPSHSQSQYLRKSRIAPTKIPDFRPISLGHNLFATASSEAYSKKWPKLFPPLLDLSPPSAPSGALFNDSSCTMNAFEAEQFNMLDQLVKKHDGPFPSDIPKLAASTTAKTESGLPGTHDFSNIAHCSGSEIPKFGVSSLPQPAVNNGLSRVVLALPGYVVCQSTALNTLEKPKLAFKTWDKFHDYMKDYMKDHKTYGANFDGAFRFSFQVDGQTFTAHSTRKPFTSSSAENISTTFTPEDWHGKFEAGEDYFGKDMPSGPSRGTSSSRTRTRSPQKSRPHINTKQSFPNIDPEILQQPSSADAATPSPGTATFSPEEWAQTFKAPTFAAPPYPSPGTSGKAYSRSGSTRRTKIGSSSSKGPSASKSAGAAAAMVESDDDSDQPMFMGSRIVPPSSKDASDTARGGLVGSPVGSPNAMDIDPPLPTNDARNVNVEPSRPEWRAGDSNGIAFNPPMSTASAQNLSSEENTLNSRKSKLKEPDLAANFEDLKKTEPIYTPASGLSSFADLTSNLPFTSKASSSAPFGKGFNATGLALPPPPRGPSPPAIAPSTPRPSQGAWDSYLASMKAYMAEWDNFNTKMMMHFVARKNQVDQFPNGWMGTIGGKDVARYLEGLTEDEKVREWWDVACQKHRKAIEDFFWAREVFKSGLQAAGPRSGVGGGEKLFGEVV